MGSVFFVFLVLLIAVLIPPAILISLPVVFFCEYLVWISFINYMEIL